MILTGRGSANRYNPCTRHSGGVQVSNIVPPPKIGVSFDILGPPQPSDGILTSLGGSKGPPGVVGAPGRAQNRRKSLFQTSKATLSQMTPRWLKFTLGAIFCIFWPFFGPFFGLPKPRFVVQNAYSGHFEGPISRDFELFRRQKQLCPK